MTVMAFSCHTPKGTRCKRSDLAPRMWGQIQMPPPCSTNHKLCNLLQRFNLAHCILVKEIQLKNQLRGQNMHTTWNCSWAVFCIAFPRDTKEIMSVEHFLNDIDNGKMHRLMIMTLSVSWQGQYILYSVSVGECDGSLIFICFDVCPTFTTTNLGIVPPTCDALCLWLIACNLFQNPLETS